MEYAFNFKNHGTFTPSGKDDSIQDADAHNRELERAEIEMLKQHPDKLFLYVKHGTDGYPHSITTWLGTVVNDFGRQTPVFGNKVHVGFGYSYRRSVDCVIFGVRYVGWYFESSGSYCRLRKAKNQ
jgi:hypothetical protein